MRRCNFRQTQVGWQEALVERRYQKSSRVWSRSCLNLFCLARVDFFPLLFWYKDSTAKPAESILQLHSQGCTSHRSRHNCALPVPTSHPLGTAGLSAEVLPAGNSCAAADPQGTGTLVFSSEQGQKPLCNSNCPAALKNTRERALAAKWRLNKKKSVKTGFAPEQSFPLRWSTYTLQTVTESHYYNRINITIYQKQTLDSLGSVGTTNSPKLCPWVYTSVPASCFQIIPAVPKDATREHVTFSFFLISFANAHFCRETKKQRWKQNQQLQQHQGMYSKINKYTSICKIYKKIYMLG